MKTKNIIIHVLTVLLALPFMGTSARAISYTIDVLETFDYPGAGNLTRPQKINDKNEIVGIFVDSSGVTRGFTRAADGTFSAPIVEPNDTGNFTEGRGINNSETICGDYSGSDGLFHGFFLSGGTFTEYDVAGADGTEVLGINNAGDFAGTYVPSGSGAFQAFVNIGGIVTPIVIPDATFSGAYQLNASNQFVGYYTDSGAINHGIYLDNGGTLRFPVDPDGSTGTIFFGLNNRAWVVGRFSDSAGATHGVLFVSGNRFVVFDFPGSTFTSFNGINQKNYICGRYIDNSGIEHGILARARRTTADEAGLKVKMVSPSSAVRATSPSSPALPSNVPAS
jgi:hypothetical protein